MTQVAASALAAVAGAVLASELGVYGTVLGAAVVSIGATTGSAVFQHVFRRTGEQLRSAVTGVEQAGRPAPEPLVELSSAWNEPQLVRAKRRWTWKSYAVASALVFGMAMVPVLAVELVAGKPMHDITTGQQGSGTSLNPGGGKRTTDDPPPSRQPSPGSTSGSTDPAGVPVSPSASGPSSSAKPSGSPSGSASPTPSGSPSSGAAAPDPTPSGAAPTGGSGDAVSPSAVAPATP